MNKVKEMKKSIASKHIFVLIMLIVFILIASVAFADPSGPVNDVYEGLWYWPVANKNRSSASFTSYVQMRWGKPHYGVDIQYVKGIDCLAARDGIAYANPHPDKFDANGKKIGYTHPSGNYVIIDHGDGYYTRYAHLDSISFTGNKIVKAGNKLGVCGTTGSSTGPHLHFEIVYCNQGSGKQANYFQSEKGANKWGDSHWKVLKPNIQNYTTDCIATGIVNASTLEFRDVVYPKTYKINTAAGWDLAGGLLVSNNDLKTLSVKIQKADGTVISQMTSPRNLSGKVFSINSLDGEGKDNGQKFSWIKSAGSYIWVMTATDSSGKSLTLEMPFTAKSDGKTTTATVSKVYSSLYDETLMSGIYRFIRNDDCRSGPGESYQEVRKISSGTVVFVVASALSDYNYTWYKLSDGTFVWSGDVEKVNLTEIAVSGQYRFTTSDQSHVWPYSTSNTLRSYAQGAVVKVTAKVVNTDNKTWYKLADGSYVWGGNLELATEVNELQFVGVMRPVNYNINSTKGYILTAGTLKSNKQLKTITTTIMRDDETVVSGPKTRPISGYSYDIKTLDTMENADNGVKFSYIKQPGNYIWELSATDASGGDPLIMKMYFTASYSSTTSQPISRKISDTDEELMSVIISNGETSGESLSETYYGYDDDQIVTLVAQALPENAKNTKIKWTSSNEKVLKLNSSEEMGEGVTLGKFTRTGVGNTVITATAVDDSTKKATFSYTYNISGINLQAQSNQIEIGESITIIPQIVPSVAGPQDVVWDSTSPGIASVDSNGVVRGVSAGSTIITATAKSGGAKGSCTVTVTSIPVQGVSIIDSSIRLYTGTSYELQYDILPYFATNQNVIWSSSDPSIATVDSNGCVTAVSYGTVDITVTTIDGGREDSCQVTVFDNIIRGAWGTFNWQLDDGELTVSGSGNMNPFDMDGDDSLAWRKYKNNISSVVIQNGVTGIGDFAFADCNLLSVTLPAGLTSIGNAAFENCDNLTDITIPDGVLSVGNWTFAGCSSLTGITVPDSVITIGEFAFYGCSSLTSVVLSRNLTGIAECTFGCCEHLRAPVIPIGVTSIGKYAFYNCSEISELSIPDSVASIGEEAFSFCNDKFRMTVTAHSAGADYALENGLPCTINGTWGSLTWNLKKDYQNSASIGELSITGSGSMNDFSSESTRAWLEYKDEINTVYINSGIMNISCHAFGNCNNLQEFYISSYEKISLDDWAIYDCGALKSVYMCYTLDRIGKRVFSNCNSLVRIDLAHNLERIEEYAFSGCNHLERVSFSENVNHIGTGAFSECPNLSLFTVPRYSYAMEYAESHGIPYRYTGNWWGDLQWQINWWHDQNEDSYEDLIISGAGDMDDYTKGSTEGWQNRQLASHDYDTLRIRDGVTSIGAYAFQDCQINKVTIASSVTRIGPYAFYGCHIGTLIIPGSVVSIDPNAFGLCTVNNFVFDSEAFSYNDGILFNKSQDTLLCAIQNRTTKWTYSIPESVTNISDYAFSHCSFLTNIAFPENMTVIGKHAFAECTSLIECHIPVGISRIENNTFYHCQNMETVTIPEGIVSIGNEAFAHCYSLTEITIPQSVTQIGARAFYQSISIRKISIPVSVTSIGENAFRYCSSDLVLLVVPGSYAYDYAITNGIRYQVVENTVAGGASGNIQWIITKDGILNIYGSGEIQAMNGNDSWAPYRSIIKGITIHGGITGICSNAFRDFDNLENIVMANTVTAIHSNAFNDCDHLQRINISGSIGIIEEGAFADCSNLESIIVDADNAYYSSIDGVLFNKSHDTLIACPSGMYGAYVIPDGVTTIEDKAFYGCSRLSAVIIPDSIQTIGIRAFGNCYSMMDIEIPVGVSEIGQNAFAGCMSLSGISIPASVNNIGVDAFNRCSNLVEIFVDSGNQHYSSVDGILYNKQHTTLILVPEGRTGKLHIPRGVKIIGTKALNNSSLSYVGIPRSVTSISQNAFLNCHELEKVIIPDSVTSISDTAFSNCKVLNLYAMTDSAAVSYAKQKGISYKAMKTLILPKGLTAVDSEAFAGSACEAVIIPEGCLTIDSEAFANCSNLMYVYIPSTISSIHDTAFQGCEGCFIDTP